MAVDRTKWTPAQTALDHEFYKWMKVYASGDSFNTPCDALDMISIALSEIYAPRPAILHQWYLKNGERFKEVSQRDKLKALGLGVKYLEHVCQQERMKRNDQAKALN